MKKVPPTPEGYDASLWKIAWHNSARNESLAHERYQRVMAWMRYYEEHPVNESEDDDETP